MTDVVRYWPNRDGGMCEAANGLYVRIEDYRLLEAKLAYIEAGEAARLVEVTRQSIKRAEEAEKHS